MRHLLISVLLAALVAGCSSVKLGPHRIDVQQGNALDQENVARLKPGLNRSQVRFLLGTPLVVDPFRGNRWDYVYVFYKAGKLAEQKRITLFFEDDTLARIEGDVPQEVADAQTRQAATASAPLAAPAAAGVIASEARALAPAAEPIPEATPDPAAEATPETAPASAAAPAPAPAAPAASYAPAPAPVPASEEAVPETSVVAALPSPKNAPAYVEPRVSAETGLRSDTDVAKIQPDVLPPFPGTEPAAGNDTALLKTLTEWAEAWSRRDAEAYFAAYDERFLPADGATHEAWRRRKLQAFDATKSLEVKIDSPVVERTEEGTATVTFKQYFRSDSYRDAVLKQLLMVERDGRWLIVEEKVLTTLRGARP